MKSFLAMTLGMLLVACSTTDAVKSPKEISAPNNSMGYLAVTIDGVPHKWWAVPDLAPNDPYQNVSGWFDDNGRVFASVVLHFAALEGQPEKAVALLTFTVGEGNVVDDVRMEYYPNGLQEQPQYMALFDYVVAVEIDTWTMDGDRAKFSGSIAGALVRLSEDQSQQYKEERHVTLDRGVFDLTLAKSE